jgi:bifunctional NMN adenylyltransferase/nudix hydrolase
MYPDSNNRREAVATDKPPIATPQEDAAWTAAFKACWANTPYPPVFVTVDAVLIRDGKLLLIRRGGMPGRGRLALPGGYVEQNERLRDAVLRELIEETQPALNRRPMSAEELAPKITQWTVFDDPNRSARGRVITTAYRFDLTDPSIQFAAGDDAGSVGWHELSALQPAEFFEDHFHIVKTMMSDDPHLISAP